jgi:hypothetical protein
MIRHAKWAMALDTENKARRSACKQLMILCMRSSCKRLYLTQRVVVEAEVSPALSCVIQYQVRAVNRVERAR